MSNDKKLALAMVGVAVLIALVTLSVVIWG